ncbi:MAG: hypothetical protein WEF86_01270 [Gemmatimonadota bacterium]
MLNLMIPLLLLVGPQQSDTLAEPDTAETIREAASHVYRHYEVERPRSTDACRPLPGQPCPPRSNAMPQITSRDACRSETRAGCIGGDWDCHRLEDRCVDPADRERLIERLESLAPGAGHSLWLLRQRVGLAVKNNDPDAARRLARECGSIDWFCPALRGFVEYWIQPGAGVAQFDSALALAPARVRCLWTSPAVLWRDASGHVCGDADGLSERAWWLADPLWTRDGNEREAEHYFRHVMQWISWGAYPRDSWNTDLVALEEDRLEQALQGPSGRLLYLIRDGPPNSFLFQQHGGGAMWGIYSAGGYSFAPDREMAESPLESRAEDWAVEWDVGHERMLTTEKWYNLMHLTVVFRRGAKLRVLAAAELPPVLRYSDGTAALALGRVADLEVFAVPATPDGRGTIRAEMFVDSAGHVASIEVHGAGVVGRARHGAPAPALVNGFGISDLALVNHAHGHAVRKHGGSLPGAGRWQPGSGRASARHRGAARQRGSRPRGTPAVHRRMTRSAPPERP